MEAYNIGVYPVQDVLDKIQKPESDGGCGLADQHLTNLSINLPVSNNHSIQYVITTQDSNGQCNQSLFDTYRKNFKCDAMQNVDCYL
ncbi:MAG: hypothetical protein K0R14_1427 [Burkholderiales bacterium]|jgi:hypothetical protein|nr:hypothetical protein [Burkholderiales bacterium]